MTETRILFSENIEDLIFVRNYTEKPIRYASDFRILQKLLASFSPQNVFLPLSSDEKILNLIRESKSSFQTYSSREELSALIQEINKKTEKNKIFTTENLKNLYESCPFFAKLVGNSAAMQKLRNDLIKIASTDISVLLLGETGTGKTTIAHAIHELSERRDKPFKFAVLSNSNESLIESKLFGVSEGAFTGAVTGKGVFEESNEGTLFLDEIGEISPNIQTKLLQVLSEGFINKVGSNKDIYVDNRMIYATNANIELKVRQRLFREDLFYRINDITIKIPPLRERLEDIPDIAQSYFENNKINKILTDSAITLLQTFEWKGNVRQLEKVLKNAALLYSSGKFIEPHHIKI